MLVKKASQERVSKEAKGEVRSCDDRLTRDGWDRRQQGRG
jgi:hypothetical protein